MRAPAAGISAEATAWDMVTNAKIMGEEYGREAFAFFALSGAVIVVLASLVALATPKTKVPWGTFSMTVGGLLSAASALWALSDIDTGTMLGVTVTYGFGLYLTLVGGIVACVVGITGLLFDTNKRNALADILRQRTVLTWLGRRLAAAIALIGCVVAFVGLFTPWIVWTSQGHESGSYSAWDAITGAERFQQPLDSHVYHWLVLVGALVVLVGVLSSIAVPRLKVFWVAIATGAVLALVGVVWSLADLTAAGLHNSYTIYLTFGYGIFLTLAGCIIAVVGGLLGLVMLTQFFRRRVSHIAS